MGKARKKPNTAWRRLRYRMLSHLPGRRGKRYLSKYRTLLAPFAEQEFERALAGAAGKVCIDLGANLGIYTRAMAAHAQRVLAFEPDPWTAGRLREEIGDLANVEVIEAAAGTSDGTITLYRRDGFDCDPEKLSQSSSIVAEKRHMDTAHPFEVRVVDFARLLSEIEEEVAILKIDIEGAEVELLETLFETPAFARIGHVFVETHETRVPTLAARSEALRRRAAAMSHPRINMNWR